MTQNDRKFLHIIFIVIAVCSLAIGVISTGPISRHLPAMWDENTGLPVTGLPKAINIIDGLVFVVVLIGFAYMAFFGLFHPFVPPYDALPGRPFFTGAVFAGICGLLSWGLLAGMIQAGVFAWAAFAIRQPHAATASATETA